MMSKHFCTLLLALIAVGIVAGQSEEIPIENDNYFPPNADQSHADTLTEGSGDGTVDEPPLSGDTSLAPLLQEVQAGIENGETTTQSQEDQSCPQSCSCHFEGGTDNFIVDCAGTGLTEFPLNIDPKTTTLNIQNNKITEIPKDVAALPNLKVLNADNNVIMDLALGSVSSLTQLTVLVLSNNRLIEYPKDLKNTIDLTKLEELNLGGNDMRTELNPDTFANLQSLRKLTLAKSTPDLLQALCSNNKKSLEAVCTESCDSNLYECPDTAQNIDDNDFMNAAVLPNVLDSPTDDEVDPVLNDKTQLVTEETPQAVSSEASKVVSEGTNSQSLGKSRSGNVQELAPPVQLNNIVAEPPKDEANNQASAKDVQVSATTTTDPKTGGVDKSIIGIVVAGMVVIVAGIAIKKNWSSIRKRFSSTPRAAERAGASINGTAPEEVPLQDKEKSPV